MVPAVRYIFFFAIPKTSRKKKDATTIGAKNKESFSSSLFFIWFLEIKICILVFEKFDFVMNNF